MEVNFNYKSLTKNSNVSTKTVSRDYSFWLLLITNLITIFFAIRESWEVAVLIWIYWGQNIIIGFFNFLKILSLKEFSTEGFRINDQPVDPTDEIKKNTAFFFLLHYGFFHLIYFLFLFLDRPSSNSSSSEIYLSQTEISFVLLSIFLFFINHAFSYLFNKDKDTKKQNIGTIMFYPYARVVPMHLFIFIASKFPQQILPIFLILKTFADLTMHSIEHGMASAEELPTELSSTIEK